MAAERVERRLAAIPAADEGLEDAFCHGRALRGFAGIELNRDPIPTRPRVLNFRHWRERPEWVRNSERSLATVQAWLAP